MKLKWPTPLEIVVSVCVGVASGAVLRYLWTWLTVGT